jgi:iron complex transport system substrate-binding protein
VEADVEALRRLAPDVVITQSLCDVCAVGEGELQRVVAALDPKPRVVPLHAHDLAGVFADIEQAGDALGLRDEADELVAALRYRLRRAAETHAPRPTSHAPAPRVVVLEWLDPPYVGGHWVPELVRIAGGVDVGNRPGERSRPVPWSTLRSLAPDVVAVACCGFDAARARREWDAVSDPEARALFAAARVDFLDANAYTSRPGPRLVDAVALLAALINN